MNFGNTTIFQLTKAKMAYLGQRQAVLAQNVANVDTPGYRAKEIKAPDFGAMVKNKPLSTGKMVQTHQRHMSGLGAGGAFPVIDRKLVDEHNPDENGVNIDTELQKVAFTQAEYSKVISIYRKNIQLVRTAIGSQNG